MQVMVSVGDGPGDGARALTLHAAVAASPLVHEAHVGAGVHVRVDLLAPQRFCAVSVEELDETSAPLVATLIGERALRTVRVGRSSRVTVEPDASAPWLRVAAVDALDRWLHLPLDQALVDAERAVSRWWAAASLPAGSPAQQLVVGDALRLARHASTGVVRHLRQLTRAGAPLQERLRFALDRLVAGYAELAAQVTGPDQQLAAVGQAWRALSEQRMTAEPAPPRPPGRPRRTSAPGPLVQSPIDPRLVPARLLGVSADPGSAELYPAPGGGAGAVRIEVPVFAGTDVDEGLARRLLVRLVDRRTSDSLGHGLLTMVPATRGAARRRFEATVPLVGRKVTDVRADVYDVLGGAPPAVRDGGTSVREARCATVFLGEWRRLVALARLSGDRAALVERLRPLAERLRAAATDAPPFPGCPPVTRLLDLLAEGVDPVESLLTAGADIGSDDALGFASGVGRLLVAELAAAGRG